MLVDRDMPGLKVSKVLVNNFRGGYEGMVHLLELGHRRVGVIGAPAYSAAMRQRLQGVRRALADFHLEASNELLVTGTLQQYEMGYETARQLLTQADRPTAIFALTDVAAVGAMHAAASLGLRLPADLSVVGFDDIALAKYMIPELTTVAQPIYEMGTLAARLLLDHLSAPDEEAHDFA